MNEIITESSDIPNLPISQDTTVSEPVSMPPSEPEAPKTDFTPEVVNDTTPQNTENKAKIEEIEQNTENTLENQPILKPEENLQSTATQTAQIPPTEPLKSKSEPLDEQVSIPVITPPPQNKIRELLAKAQFAIQIRKQKKKDKIMMLFLKKQSITNDEVEKLLHVSDATATRYLSALEKDGKIKQNSKTGKGVSYSKI